MAGLPNTALKLDAVYVAAADRARRTVAAAFDLDELPVTVLPRNAQHQYRVVWRIRLDAPELPISYLLLAIPLTFPDELPDVYLLEELTYAGARIPHLDQKLQLCTFDASVAYPNAEQAGEAVCAVIQRAVQLVCEGVSGTNAVDYADEFEAYWEDSAEKADAALAIIRPDGAHRRVVLAEIVPALGSFKKIFAETEGAAVEFLDAIGRALPKPATPALYLHFNDFGRLPNLLTNIDVYRHVSSNQAARDALIKFLEGVKRPSTVLFSFPARGERVLAAWVHRRYGTDVYRGKDTRRIMDKAPGFRQDHLPANVELTGKYAGLRLGRTIVRRADDSRLISRTAGYITDVVGKVTIIGCGSVGGFVADTVGHLRPSLLRLVDPQDMDVHNVPRHLCDMTSVGMNKAHAVRASLRRFCPHLIVESYDQDVLDILRVNDDDLTPAEQTFVAVANIAVERRLNALSCQLALGAVIYLWIEPHAVAGHAIVVPPSARGCFECLLDPNMHMTVRVLQNSEQFERADAGCRGAYLPYSGLDVQTFARAITRAALACSDASESTVVTWIGDIDRARNSGWRIYEDWANASPFSISSRHIIARPDCPICGHQK